MGSNYSLIGTPTFQVKGFRHFTAKDFKKKSKTWYQLIFFNPYFI